VESKVEIQVDQRQSVLVGNLAKCSAELADGHIAESHKAEARIVDAEQYVL
jgi:hypothetical protein